MNTTRIIAAALLILAASTVHGEQLVVLDFDSFTDGTSDSGKDHFYSPPERAYIVTTLNSKFSGLPVTFTDIEPPTGLFSKVYFNVGLSDSGDVDFQNTKKIDDASIHIPKLLEIAGLTAPFSPFDVGTASVNIAAHETLHLLGTRHHDSFLPIGSGVPTPSVGGDFDPPFPGPAGASLTAKEFNSLTLGLGFSAGKLLDPTLFIGPRSGVKLLLDTIDVDVDSADANDIFEPQTLIMKTIPIPNKMPPPPPPLPGEPAEPELLFFADVAIVEDATIEPFDPPDFPGPEGDYYKIFAAAGDHIHIEVMSKILDYRFSDIMDTAVAVLDPTAAYSPVPWHTSTAIADDERESTDTFLFDLVIPATGEYVIEVFPGGSDAFGEYEMLVYNIHSVEVPEPSTIALALFGVGLMTARRCIRKKR